MPQANIFIEDDENEIILKYSKIWKKSKAETIKEIIKRFKNGDIK